jgi:urate oxidase
LLRPRVKTDPRRRCVREVCVPLIRNTYGKGRVRIMRIHRDGERQDVSELTLKVMLEGDAFARAYTDADNATSTSTDTIKNIVNVTARENAGHSPEELCRVLAQRYFDLYPQVDKVSVTSHETRWRRLEIDGRPHPHSFVRDSNGKPTVAVRAERGQPMVMSSGIDGFTFMKSTESGWENFFTDRFSTIKPTADRMCATSMVASWLWSKPPADYAAANETILATLLKVFATTYSPSVQNSLYHMGEAALAAVPEIAEISMACPNIHYILMDLSAFGLDNKNDLFLPTDEPHGQIECTVGRG